MSSHVLLPPLNVSTDGGASTTPSTLSFVGFSGADNSGVITISGSNFTYYGGTNISIDGSNNINCDISPLAVVLDGGASTTPSTLSFVGFTTTESASNVTVNAPSAGQNLTAGYGVSISNVGVVQNT